MYRFLLPGWEIESNPTAILWPADPDLLWDQSFDRPQKSPAGVG
jgi:hypothetical protein